MALGEKSLGPLYQPKGHIHIWRQNSQQRSRSADIVETPLELAILFEQEPAQKRQPIPPVTALGDPDIFEFAESLIHCRPREVERSADVSIVFRTVSQTLDDRCPT